LLDALSRRISLSAHHKTNRSGDQHNRRKPDKEASENSYPGPHISFLRLSPQTQPQTKRKKKDHCQAIRPAKNRQCSKNQNQSQAQG
jgi:hypothetical protein